MSYVLFADSACDIKPELLEKWGVHRCALSFRFEGDKEHFDGDIPTAVFYQRMREGGIAKTAAANSEAFKDAFRPHLSAGQDILYIAFSSGLSTTFQSGMIAAQELIEEFPSRRVVCVDSLAASAGYGMLVWLAKQQLDAGATLDETLAYVEATRLHICHWFTVSDLTYLKRGGRVSATAALVGGMLNIKPVLHVDNEGHLINISKVRGRKSSIKAIADQFKQRKIADSPIFISHGDCLDDARELARLIEAEGCKVELITDVGTVIGSHSGPGTLALFFLGSER